MKLQLARLIRSIISFAAAIVLLLAFVPTASAAENPSVRVYRDPNCRCCGGWMDHLAAQGFQIHNFPTADLDALKQQYGVPETFTSCHTAVIDSSTDRYVIEGHVPVEDIKRLLAERPHTLGLTVPGMPIGTPGMESDDEQEPFTVFSFDQQGNTQVFSQH